MAQIAELALLEPDHDVALHLQAAVSESHRRLGIVRAHWQQRRADEALTALREAFGVGLFTQLWTAGSKMTFDEMVAAASEYLG
ncbi:MAG: hypothetical protein GY722_00300 [bacterium]|nr:hypothetical protein [bacterium]